MIESFKDIPNLNDSWAFLFLNKKKLSKKVKTKVTKKSYYFILNSEAFEMEFVSKSITDVLGYLPGEFTMVKLFSSIHPDDLEYCRECEYNSLQMSNNLYCNEQHRYSFQYTYRIKAQNGSYITIKQSYSTIEVDDDGHVVKRLVLHERVANYEIRTEDDFKIFDKSKNKSITTFKKYKLSERELEIVGLIQKGYKSYEIADKLFLSKSTIDTHRKNILRKTNSSSLFEIINKLSL